MIATDIVNKLKEEGHRITPIRTKILNVLGNLDSPISAPDLLESVKLDNETVNKTTIYRELDFLLKKDLVSEVEFGDGKKRYELNDGHHHHLICLNCKKVEDIDLSTDLSEEEKDIEKNTGFKIQNHSLEFFGLCKNCKNSQ